MPDTVRNDETIAAIHGRESQTGQWSGSGVMLGTGGLGVGVGGGSMQTQTVRAQAFAPPPSQAWTAFLPAVFFLGAALLLPAAPGIVGMFIVTNEQAQYATKLFSVFQNVLYLLSGVAFAVGLIRLFGMPNSQEFIEASQLDERQAAVYNRLRYNEQDNMVFDPETEKSCRADRASILNMISDIAGKPSA